MAHDRHLTKFTRHRQIRMQCWSLCQLMLVMVTVMCVVQCYEWEDWDYYELLEIRFPTRWSASKRHQARQQVTPKELRKSYREQAKLYHPDKSSSKEFTARFLKISEAYDTLSNEEQKQEYDSYLREVERRRGTQRTQRPSSSETPPPSPPDNEGAPHNFDGLHCTSSRWDPVRDVEIVTCFYRSRPQRGGDTGVVGQEFVFPEGPRGRPPVPVSAPFDVSDEDLHRMDFSMSSEPQTLRPGDVLETGQVLASSNQRYELHVTDDCELVLLRRNSEKDFLGREVSTYDVLWSSDDNDDDEQFGERFRRHCVLTLRGSQLLLFDTLTSELVWSSRRPRDDYDFHDHDNRVYFATLEDSGILTVHSKGPDNKRGKTTCVWASGSMGCARRKIVMAGRSIQTFVVDAYGNIMTKLESEEGEDGIDVVVRLLGRALQNTTRNVRQKILQNVHKWKHRRRNHTQQPKNCILPPCATATN